ncbi:MAG: GNAT family N-acetyltransferase [Clostridia bacterium]|jgi:ribosomal protein S18 acetylase RimI-like enzyme
MPEVAWRLVDQGDEPALRSLLLPREIHATSLSERIRTPAPFRNDRDRLLVHPAGIRRLDAVLFLSASGCAMPLVDPGLDEGQAQGLMSALKACKTVRAFRPASCVGLESATRALQLAMGWRSALTIRYDAMSLDAADFTPAASAVQSAVIFSDTTTRYAVPDDLEALMPVARAYEMEEVSTPMHPYDEAVCRANQARSLARYRVRILEVDGRVAARAQTNAVGYAREQLGGIIVLSQLRGRGYGRRVVTELAASILGEGKGLSLFVKKGNVPARGLYEDLGFRVSGDFRVDYFS